MARTRRQVRADASAALFASILQSLVDSGHVSVKDIGRLAQVSKEVNQAAIEEDIWASFCQRAYPCTSRYRVAYRERKGYRWLYQHWSTPVAKRRPPPQKLGPPSSSFDEMSFFIQVSYDGSSLFEGAYGAQAFARFLFSTGSAGIALENGPSGPIIIGKAIWNRAETSSTFRPSITQRLPVSCKDFDESKLIATIHVASRAGQCCIYNSKDRKAFYGSLLFVCPVTPQGQPVSANTKFDLSKEQKQGRLSYSEWKEGRKTRLPLNHSRMAQEIMSRFPHHVEFKLGYRLNVENEDQFAITQITIEASYLCPERMELCKFNSDEEKEKSGVTLLHYLSELQNFEEPAAYA